MSSTAFVAITIERKDTSISTNANSSTKPKTSGIAVFIWSAKSMAFAVLPVTATSAPVSVPRVGGMISLRSVARAFSEVASVPLPSVGMLTTATVFAALTSTSIGSFMTPLSSARHLSWPIASLTDAVSTFGALITTCAVFSVPGNASLRRL